MKVIGRTDPHLTPIILPRYGTMAFYLPTGQEWYSYNLYNASYFGSGSTPSSTLSTAYDHIQGTHAVFMATRPCIIHRVRWSFYWAGPDASGDHEFQWHFHKYNTTDADTSAITLTNLTATNTGAKSCTENLNYIMDFEFTDKPYFSTKTALAWYMRRTAATGVNGVIATYGTAMAEVEFI